MVCAIPTGNIPEYSVINKDEYVRDRGWRAILRIILDRKLVSREKFWKVLHKNGIYHIDQAIMYETADGNLYHKKTTSFNDYHK